MAKKRKRGDGSVHLRKDGRWEGRVVIGYDDNGYPKTNTVLYQKGSGIDYYIGQAGGFGNRALKRRAYVVYMNGTVSRLRRNTANAIELGCEIIVPSKGERKKMTTAGAVGMSSSIASIAAMVASMVSLTK